jgi:hypothetical protein
MKPGKSSREWPFRIKDILQAIDKIEQYTKNMTASEFKNNKLVVDAVLRNFEGSLERQVCISRTKFGMVQKGVSDHTFYAVPSCYRYLSIYLDVH